MCLVKLCNFDPSASLLLVKSILGSCIKFNAEFDYFAVGKGLQNPQTSTRLRHIVNCTNWLRSKWNAELNKPSTV